MSDIIQLLPDSLANQIAAGEVVQRPAAAAKELLENSIDAGATRIELSLQEGGKTSLQVMDNGKGMSYMDARMCFERHATSKIKKPEDLFSIRTMGFRGEAMASIAAVAQVQLKTRQVEDEIGTEIIIEGSDLKKQSPCMVPKGTIITVKYLFFNVPARRNFLKSSAQEARYVIQEFQRIALAHPAVSFVLNHQDNILYNLTGGTLLDRILQVFGPDTQESLIPVEEITPYVSIKGYVGKPASARKIRGDQFFFVNDRYIKDPALHHAVLSAYEDTLSPNTFPLYVVYIEIAPEHLDVNIHPSKTEIKFDDPQAVYQLLRSAIRKAIGGFHLTGDSVGSPLKGEGPSLPDTQWTVGDMARRQQSRLPDHNWQALMGKSLHTQSTSGNSSFGSQPLFPHFAPTPESYLETPTLEALQVFNRYLVISTSTGLQIADLIRIRQRIFYESLLQQSVSPKHTQTLLYPQNFNTSPAEALLLDQYSSLLNTLGFDLRQFGPNTWLISGIPEELDPQQATEILKGLLAEAEVNSPGDVLKIKWAQQIALQHKYSQPGKLKAEEIRNLVHTWKACQQPALTPDGKPICRILNEESLIRLLNS
jgi:DNA mismatch repair protein MutL